MWYSTGKFIMLRFLYEVLHWLMTMDFSEEYEKMALAGWNVSATDLGIETAVNQSLVDR